MGGGVHDSYTFQCGLVGSFTSPGIDTRRDQRLLKSHPKDTGKRGKRNCQSSEEKSFYQSGTRTIERHTCQPREKFWRDKRGATKRGEPTSEGESGGPPPENVKTYIANCAIYVIPELYL